MMLPTAPYEAQARRWPAERRHILAHFDDRSVIVYEAYRPSIGRFATDNSGGNRPLRGGEGNVR